jgi:SHS2 domain-containing protein
MSFDFLEHTADIRIALRAPEMPGLLESAADALYAVALYERTEAETTVRSVSIEAFSPEELLVRWLQELLYLLNTEHFVMVDVRWPADVDWQSYPVSMTSKIGGYHCGPAAHAEEIKAITYHGLEVTRTTDGFYAELILDI